MALPVKESRLITVDGSVYRWRVRSRPTYGQDCLGDPLTFAAELTGARDSVLAVTITGASRPDSAVPLSGPGLVVRPALAAAIITRALDQGWQSAAPGRQFRLSLTRDDLPAEARTELDLALPSKSAASPTA